MYGHLMLAVTLVSASLALAACAQSGSGGESEYRKQMSDYQKSIQRNGRPPVGGARAND
ncbi:hypothetical protein [Dongia sp.]|uniref:hypothetical protein n=1 Tax=Dongia sp. TaxID=1977262 RepID=UPI0035B15372